jgi:hypothetical protein
MCRGILTTFHFFLWRRGHLKNREDSRGSVKNPMIYTWSSRVFIKKNCEDNFYEDSLTGHVLNLFFKNYWFESYKS